MQAGANATRKSAEAPEVQAAECDDRSGRAAGDPGQAEEAEGVRARVGGGGKDGRHEEEIGAKSRCPRAFAHVMDGSGEKPGPGKRQPGDVAGEVDTVGAGAVRRLCDENEVPAAPRGPPHLGKAGEASGGREPVVPEDDPAAARQRRDRSREPVADALVGEEPGAGKLLPEHGPRP